MSKSELSLREIQSLMGAIVMNPLDEEFESLPQLKDGRSFEETAKLFSKANSRLSGAERIAVYNRQYWYRLIDCLYDDFPGLVAVMGREQFNKLINSYLDQNPSTSHSLRDLGEKLPQFMRDHPKLTGRNKTAALEMAQFEWAQTVAFDSLALTPVTPEYLAGTAPENLRFRLQPYLVLLEMSYPFDDYIVALHSGEREETVRSEAGVTELKAANDDDLMVPLPAKKKIYLAVHRFHNSLYYKRLDRPALHLLRQFGEGNSLTEALENISGMIPKRAHAKLPEMIQGWFRSFSELNWLCPPED